MGSISQGSTVEPGQGAQPSPPCWHQPAHVPALGGVRSSGCPSHTPLSSASWGAGSWLSVPPSLSSALGPQSCLWALPAVTGDAPAQQRLQRTLLLPSDKGEWVGGCWHHIPSSGRARELCRESSTGGHSSEVGTTDASGARLVGLMGLQWLWMKSSVSAGNMHTPGQALHGSLPRQRQVPGCESSPAPRALGCRE